MGKLLIHMTSQRKLNLEAFLALHPVFSLEELAAARGDPAGLDAARNQLKHHLRRGRVKRVARSVFASIPHGREAGSFQPDAVLVASSVCPEGIFSHHAALELLGAGHSAWQGWTLLCDSPPAPIRLGPQAIRFLAHPIVLVRRQAKDVGVRPVEWEGRTVQCTGPERALVDGFRQPRRVGGVAELLESASGFGVLDLDLLQEVLQAYDQQTLWAAVGWFLQRRQEHFSVPEDYLATLEERSPGQPRYLVRSEQGGKLAKRWNLIIPEHLLRWEGQDAEV